MHVIRTVETFQGHPVPTRVTRPQGPFPPELFMNAPIVYNDEQAFAEDGSNFPLGATAQNNFTPLKWFRCRDCENRVREDELDLHECDF